MTITQNGALKKDDNDNPVMGGTSSVDNATIINAAFDPITRRLLTDAAAGSGTVTSISVVSANGLAGTVATATTTPAITLSTTITGILKGNGTAISAGVASDVDSILPTQATHSGQFLTTDGSVSSWATVSGSGTVNSGTAGQIAYYASSTNAVSGNANITISSSAITLGVAGSAVGTLKFANATSGTITLSPSAGALGTSTLTLPIATDTLVGKATTDTFTNKTYDTAGTGNSFLINGVAVTANTGTGAVARAAGPVFTTPTLGAATATTINGNTFTAGTYTLTGQAGKTLTFNGSITLTGTDAQTYTFPTTSATIARTDAANTFTGVQTMTSPALTTPAITGLATGSGVASAATVSTLASRDANGNSSFVNVLEGYTTTATAAGTTTLTVASTYQQFFTGSTTQIVVLPVASTLVLGQSYYFVNNSTGLVTVQSSGANNVAILGANGTSAIITCVLTSGTSAASWVVWYNAVSAAAGKSALFNNIMTMAGTDNTTMTFPSTSQTVAGLTSTQTFTNKRITRRLTTVSGPGATPTTNTDNVDVANFTALAVAITSMSTNLSGTPVDGDLVEFRFTDNGTARAITWGASFGSTTVTLPTTTVISTMLRVLVEWNGTIWQCIAVA